MTRRRALLLAAAAAALATIPVASSAEVAWVKDEVRLQKRTGPGTQFRILGAVTTGDSVEVRYDPADPERVQLEGGLRQRAGSVFVTVLAVPGVLLTLGGLVFGLMAGVAALRRG